MKKILAIIAGVILVLVLAFLLWYSFSLKEVSKEQDEVTFIVASGTGTKEVINSLEDASLIKNKYAVFIYYLLHRDISVKAGTYTLNRNMDVKTIFETLEEGGKSDNTIAFTFKEGDRLEKFLKQIADKTEFNYDDLITKINSKEFLEPLINEYWFLTTDILKDGIYYPLEGYLYPNTYEVYKTAKIEDIISKMLKETEKQLEAYKTEIEKSTKSVHDILTIASIAEKEAIKEDDRKKVTQVIYKRMNLGMSLGMDVTAYYGARKEMTEKITKKELDDSNPYNTRITSFKGLPIGPICNPSTESIEAALNPANTDYIYFFADIATKNVYFTNNYNEFQSFKETYGR